MKLKDEDQIVDAIVNHFLVFGGGRSSDFNPIAAALKDRPPMFAAGVDVRDVVRFVLMSAANRRRRSGAVRRRRKGHRLTTRVV